MCVDVMTRVFLSRLEYIIDGVSECKQLLEKSTC